MGYLELKTSHNLFYFNAREFFEKRVKGSGGFLCKKNIEQIFIFPTLQRL